MSIQLYNTLTNKKEPLETLEPGKIKMYVCGPTVYNKAHIGHAMSAMVFDNIRRYLEYRGYEVQFAMNFTDVDDKIIKRANEMGVDPFKLAEGYIDDFQQDMKDLNIKPATFNPRATQEIDEIIKIVQGLVDKGYAYPLDGDVYFRVRKDPGYGKLSGRNVDDMRSGFRKEVDDRKEDPLDFALWKSAKPGEPSWDSPWGPGRPGWHIECSAMNHHLYGDSIDIHGGGNDLIFPHHENEIAQSECYTGKPFARYWMHNGMLRLGKEKMSKSLGNIISIQDFLKEHSANAFRYLILNSAYRNPILFDNETLAQAEKAVERLKGSLKPANPKTEIKDEEIVKKFNEKIASVKEDFIANMDDDFNSAGALGCIFELVREINSMRDQGASQAQLDPAQNQIREFADVFGLVLEEEKTDAGQSADVFIQMLVDLRFELKKQKNWPLADQIRKELSEQGITIEDSKEGSLWYRNA